MHYDYVLPRIAPCSEVGFAPLFSISSRPSRNTYSTIVTLFGTLNGQKITFSAGEEVTVGSDEDFLLR